MFSQQSQSLTWHCACHILLALHFDNHPGRGKRQAVQQGSCPGYFSLHFRAALSSALSGTQQLFYELSHTSFCPLVPGPVSLVRALSLHFFSLSVRLRSLQRPPPLPRCHGVHMAPACDTEPSQNTPDAPLRPSTVPDLVKF